jgi:hypothetical protein
MRKIDRLPSMFIDSVAELIKHDPLEIGLGLFHGNSSTCILNATEKDELLIQIKTLQKVSKAGEVPLMYSIKAKIKYLQTFAGKDRAVEMTGEYSIIIKANRSINLNYLNGSYHTDYRQVIDFVVDEVFQKMITQARQYASQYGLKQDYIQMPAVSMLEEAKSKQSIGYFNERTFNYQRA